LRQRLILVVPAAVGGATLARALSAGDVAAVVLDAAAPGVATEVVEAQGRGVAVLLAGEPAWPVRYGADGVHATGPLARRLAVVRGRPEGATVGAVASTRHEAMTLGEAGADYVWFGGPACDDNGAELAAWWHALFEVPAVIEGPGGWLSTMIATSAEFIAVNVFDGPDDAAVLVANATASLSRGLPHEV
jgi:thiamine-phosphate pyrophosphorylase